MRFMSLPGQRCHRDLRGRLFPLALLVATIPASGLAAETDAAPRADAPAPELNARIAGTWWQPLRHAWTPVGWAGSG